MAVVLHNTGPVLGYSAGGDSPRPLFEYKSFLELGISTQHYQVTNSNNLKKTNMAAKFMTFACLVAAAAAVHVPVAKVAYAPAQVQYAAAPVQYASAPVQYASAPVHYAAPVAYSHAPVAKLAYAEPEAPAHYDYEYSVQDSHTGDVKQQKESRQGDAVHGSYSLVQPDGVQRIVEYTSDKEHGFNAIVRYEGQPKAYVAPAQVAKVAYAPAQVQYAAAPVHYAAAPVAKVAYAPAQVQYHAAPVAKVAYAPAQVQYHAAPVAKVAYAPAQVQYHAAPVAKLAYAAAPAQVYTQNLGHVSYSSPSVSYHH
ncbi:unnamed protein product [Plutella xylostella]|uniref:(diamondback moth) hypothetical protein n=1 Tax=Plutella xylostella TaxID=51655 RepID=A0A8S4FZU8_PLUXY|nr:unnamed protein product [Plutella xylostella]